VCQETGKPRVRQPILRFATTEAGIEASPPMRMVLRRASLEQRSVVPVGWAGGPLAAERPG
jgi:hypothetical protein